jgi:hypothetical protein
MRLVDGHIWTNLNVGVILELRLETSNKLILNQNQAAIAAAWFQLQAGRALLRAFQIDSVISTFSKRFCNPMADRGSSITR